jgi:hypothetical protein
MMDVQGIQFHFMMNNLRWRIDGELVIPTEEQLQEVIDKAVERLYAEPDGAQLEVGHLIVKRRNQDLYDVFVRYGTIGDTNE